MRPKGVVDGQQVNIPVLSNNRLTDGVTKKDSGAICWIWWFKPVGGLSRKIQRVTTPRGDDESKDGSP